jgi:hypothetical protein
VPTLWGSQQITISCSGNYVDDSVQGFYESLAETAILSKNGFGTSSYLSDIRPRGSKISTGGKSLGVLPVLKMHIQTSIDISQGGVRRGAWAGYLHICHGDFWEVYHYLENNPDDCNIGWIITDEFVGKLLNNDRDAIDRYKSVLKLKSVLGKGYFLFVDKANRLKPQSYKQHNLDIKASNLCLTGDTQVTIRYAEGLIERTNIAILSDIFKRNDYIEILSYNINTGVCEFKLIEECGLTNDNAPILLLGLDGNYSNYLHLTPEHKVYTKNRGYIEAKKQGGTGSVHRKKDIKFALDYNMPVKELTSILPK